MNIPQDPMILYSFINTKLRDEFSSLEELCEELDIDKAELEETLLCVGFEYHSELNKFI